MKAPRRIEVDRDAFEARVPSKKSCDRHNQCKVVRHGLTTETVIARLDDVDDYKAFEIAVCNGYSASNAVERELVLRLASVLWRLRRASLIEQELFSFQLRKCYSKKLGAKRLTSTDLATAFLRLMSRSGKAFNRLSRYEVSLWRQARQIIDQLDKPNRRLRGG